MSTDNDRTPPVTSASIIVLTLARRVETELNAGLATLGLTVGRLGLLGHISGVPGASFSELARMSGISVQSAHTAVRALAAAGLVHDRTARAGSASAIELTAEGEQLLRSAEQVVTEVDEQLFGAAADPLQRRIGTAVVDAFRGSRD